MTCVRNTYFFHFSAAAAYRGKPFKFLRLFLSCHHDSSLKPQQRVLHARGFFKVLPPRLLHRCVFFSRTRRAKEEEDDILRGERNACKKEELERVKSIFEIYGVAVQAVSVRDEAHESTLFLYCSWLCRFEERKRDIKALWSARLRRAWLWEEDGLKTESFFLGWIMRFCGIFIAQGMRIMQFL